MHGEIYEVEIHVHMNEGIMYADVTLVGVQHITCPAQFFPFLLTNVCWIHTSATLQLVLIIHIACESS